jgi:hypothetical protein
MNTIVSVSVFIDRPLMIRTRGCSAAYDDEIDRCPIGRIDPLA